MRAFYRGYHAATGRRAGQVRRLHVMREDGKFAGKSGLCGAPGWQHTNSPPVLIDPMPETPPAGLDWCNACVGHAAGLVGMLDRFAVTVAELAREQAKPKPVPPPEGRCARCSQTRPLFEFSWVPDGWFEFKECQMCARCHSLSSLEDEDDRLDSGPLLDRIGATS